MSKMERVQYSLCNVPYYNDLYMYNDLNKHNDIVLAMLFQTFYENKE